MKTIIEFLKSTIIGGLLVLLPLMLFGMIMGEIFDLVIALATPIADAFPKSYFAQPRFPALLAVGLIILASLLTGLLVRSSGIRRIGRWIEERILASLPGYRAIKSLIHGLFGASDDDGFKPVFYRSADDQMEIAYLVEDLGNGQVVILIPFSPTPMAGSVKIVPASKIEPIPASLADVTAVLTYWGKGTRELIRQKAASDLP